MGHYILLSLCLLMNLAAESMSRWINEWKKTNMNIFSVCGVVVSLCWTWSGVRLHAGVSSCFQPTNHPRIICRRLFTAKYLKLIILQCVLTSLNASSTDSDSDWETRTLQVLLVVQEQLSVYFVHLPDSTDRLLLRKHFDCMTLVCSREVLPVSPAWILRAGSSCFVLERNEGKCLDLQLPVAGAFECDRRVCSASCSAAPLAHVCHLPVQRRSSYCFVSVQQLSSNRTEMSTEVQLWGTSTVPV